MSRLALVIATFGWLLPLTLPRPASAEGTKLASAARAVLQSHCYRCHGEEGAAEGGFADALSLSLLVSAEYVVPRDAEGSLLWQRVSDESAPMPPEEVTPRPAADDLAALRAWIDAGAPPFADAAPPRPFISNQQVLAAVHTDLAAAPAAERRYLRYFSLAHLRNAGASDAELESHRRGLAKLVNSLSWRPDIAVPKPVEALDAVVRIDLRDYGWDSADWDEIAFRLGGLRLYETPEESQVQAWTGAATPCLPADAFVFEASQPPLYHQLLDLPETDAELERLLHVDVADSVEQGAARRAGFASSGVSRHNRMVQRHASSYGAYWKSYDFAGSSGRKSLFAHPLGPGDSVRDFEHDGGEIIFNLPNGLQAYLLVDAAGRRIDRGPIDIVSDPKRADRQVVNSVSCMTCHAGGMIPKRDEVRAHVLAASTSFRPGEVEAVRMLYAPHEEMDRLYEEDSKRHREAVLKTGAPLTETEPVAALARHYERDLDLPHVAAELGATPEGFLAVMDKSPALSRVAGALREPGGRLKRDAMRRQVVPLRQLFGGKALNPSRPQVVGQTPFQGPRTPLERSYRLNVTFGSHPKKPGLRVPVWRYLDEARRLWVYVSGAGGMAVVPRVGNESEATFQTAYYAIKRVYKAPNRPDGAKPPLEPVMIQALRDDRTGVVLYLTDEGGLAGLLAPKLSKPTEQFEDPTDTVVATNVRGPGDPYLSPSQPVLYLETVSDPNGPRDFVFSSRGGVALYRFPAGEFRLTSTHAYDLVVRPPGVDRFGDFTKHVAVEVYANPGVASLLVTSAGGLAGAFGPVSEAPTLPPRWLRSHVIDLPIDHRGESEPPAGGDQLGIEVYEDPNTGLLLYLNNLGGVAVLKAP